MTVEGILKALVRVGVITKEDTNDFTINRMALIPWARKTYDEVYPTDLVHSLQVREQFLFHKEKWKRETIHLSGGVENNPSYTAIIAMGHNVLPYIFESMTEEPDWWFDALRKITGIDPVTSLLRGQLQAMTSVWLQWARDNGYLR